MNGLFRCEYCMQDFPKKRLLELHRKQHSDRTKFQCPRCTKVVSRPNTYRQHYKREHTEELTESGNIPNPIRVQCGAETPSTVSTIQFMDINYPMYSPYAPITSPVTPVMPICETVTPVMPTSACEIVPNTIPIIFTHPPSSPTPSMWDISLDDILDMNNKYYHSEEEPDILELATKLSANINSDPPTSEYPQLNTPKPIQPPIPIIQGMDFADILSTNMPHMDIETTTTPEDQSLNRDNANFENEENFDPQPSTSGTSGSHNEITPKQDKLDYTKIDSFWKCNCYKPKVRPICRVKPRPRVTAILNDQTARMNIPPVMNNEPIIISSDEEI